MGRHETPGAAPTLRQYHADKPYFANWNRRVATAIMTMNLSFRLRFRSAAHSDLPSILDLYRQPDMDNGKALTLTTAQAVFDRINAIPGYGLYVAVHEQRIVGTFALMIMPNLGHCGTPSGVLEDIVVATGHQGVGIGTAMIGEAMRLCGAAGCYKMTLSSNLKRERAHTFYDKLGFDKHGYSFRIAIAGE